MAISPTLIFSCMSVGVVLGIGVLILILWICVRNTEDPDASCVQQSSLDSSKCSNCLIKQSIYVGIIYYEILNFYFIFKIFYSFNLLVSLNFITSIPKSLYLHFTHFIWQFWSKYFGFNFKNCIFITNAKIQPRLFYFLSRYSVCVSVVVWINVWGQNGL